MATFIDKEGSIFDSGADLLVCPVNCVPGVMGKGLALAFAKRWPILKRSHRTLCERGLLRPGVALFVGGTTGQQCAFVPTKSHWRHRSDLVLVSAGILGLYKLLAGVPEWTQGKSIAIPALGCGLGGLRWEDVRPLIVEAMAPLDITVMLYAPKEGDA